MAAKIEITVYEYTPKDGEKVMNPRASGSYATPQDITIGSEQITGKTFDVTVIGKDLADATKKAQLMLRINANPDEEDNNK